MLIKCAIIQTVLYKLNKQIQKNKENKLTFKQ